MCRITVWSSCVLEPLHVMQVWRPVHAMAWNFQNFNTSIALQEELQRWRELNTAEDFIGAAAKLHGITQSFPLLLHHKANSSQLWCSTTKKLYTSPLMTYALLIGCLHCFVAFPYWLTISNGREFFIRHQNALLLKADESLFCHNAVQSLVLNYIYISWCFLPFSSSNHLTTSQIWNQASVFTVVSNNGNSCISIDIGGHAMKSLNALLANEYL